MRDPIGYQGGMNLYAYCGNNPLNCSDPDGLLPGREYGESTLSLRERKSIGRYTKGTYAVLTAVGIAVAAGAAGWNAYAAAFYANPIATTTGTAVVGEIVAGNPGNPGSGMIGIETAMAKQATSAVTAGAASRRAIPATGSAKYQVEWHHLFPQKFSEFFSKVGIEVDRFQIPLPKGPHRLKAYNGVHTGTGNWNAVWKEWIESNPAATQEQTIEKMIQMRHDFGI